MQPWPPDAGESGGLLCSGTLITAGENFGLCSGTLITAGERGGLCSGTLITAGESGWLCRGTPITAGKSVWRDARDGSRRPQTAYAEWTFQWQKPRRKKVKKKVGNNLVIPFYSLPAQGEFNK